VIAFGLVKSQALSDRRVQKETSSAIAIIVTNCGLIAMIMINAGAPATISSQSGRPRTTSASPSTDLVTSIGLQFYWLVNLWF
jgi:hypothetical protein